MTRLPTPGSDDGTWGDILNSYLETSLASDGTLNSDVVGTAQLQNNAVTNAQLDSPTQSVIASVASKYAKPVSGIPTSDLDSTTQSNLSKANTALQPGATLGGDLSGTLPNPTVAKLNGISLSGTPSSGQVLTASSGNAASWSTPTTGNATLAADTDVSLTSPTDNQVLTYDTSSSKWINQDAAAASNATTSSPGLVQLSGDLGGTATSPTVAKLNGITITGTPSANQVLTASNSTAAGWTTPSGGSGTTDTETRLNSAIIGRGRFQELVATPDYHQNVIQTNAPTQGKPAFSTGFQRYGYGTTGSTIARQADGTFVATLLPNNKDGAVQPSGQTPVQVRFKGLGYATSSSLTDSTYPAFASGLGPFGQVSNRFVAEVMHYGTQIGFNLWSYDEGGSALFRLKVDGQYVSLAASALGAGYSWYGQAGLTFGSAAARRIEIELRGGSFLGGIDCGPTDALWLAPYRKTPQLYWVGDSFGAGTAATYPGFSDMVFTVGDRLGLDDVANDSLGGTGYHKTNGSFPDYLTRVQTNLGPGSTHQATADIVVFAGSLNDESEFNPSYTVAVGGNARLAYNWVAQQLPNAQVAVVLFGNPGNPGSVAASNASVITEITGVAGISGGPGAGWVPHTNVVGYLDTTSMITGTGRLGATTGQGTADVMMYSDNTHPTQAGHDIYARAIAEFLDQML